MTAYTQSNRPMAVSTPLGQDVLLLVGFNGREALSQLFHFELELLAEKHAPVAFDGVVGRNVTVSMRMPGGGKRYFNGIVQRFTQRGRDEIFTHFRATVVPEFWLWTKKVQSRIFQHITVPEILKRVLAGLSVAFRISGTYHPRDYCVQYRESDFAFACRLMEEEGISYFFEHAAGSHQLVLTDQSSSCGDVPGPSTIVYEEVIGGVRPENRITEWDKTQELRAGKYTLRDHCFQLSGKNLEARQTILDAVPIGKVTHKLNVGGNDALEIYDYPGGYAQRFDDVDKGGGDAAADLTKVFEDDKRTVKIRMEQEALPSLEIQGASDCPQLVPGHCFTVTRHFDADGKYLVGAVTHAARLTDNYRSGADVHFEYENCFTAIPGALPYRPARETPRPTVRGVQTAVVVGPPGEEIFCDKYGRVKVQFHWDRQGKKNAASSCWIRVGQMAAGKGFGAVNLPRIGQEVIVAFEEGDPDQPIIVGSVYNAENMPPYKLPDQRTFSGVTHRSHQGVAKNASEIRFQNQLGSELLLLHAETDSLQQAENNHLMQVGKIHRHEVGEGYHVIVGKPVDVNRTVVGIQAGAAGSGAGGGPPIPIGELDRQPLDVAPSAAEGSGAGGGHGSSQSGPTPTGASAPPSQTLADGTLEQPFNPPGLQTDVYGNNATNIYGDDSYLCSGTARSKISGDNHTEIVGADYYKSGFQFSLVLISQMSAVLGGVISYETNLLDVVALAKLEFSGLLHVDLALAKADGSLLSKEDRAIKLFTLG
jgi:type VI secretion system secreted protein VgrG